MTDNLDLIKSPVLSETGLKIHFFMHSSQCELGLFGFLKLQIQNVK